MSFAVSGHVLLKAVLRVLGEAVARRFRLRVIRKLIALVPQVLVLVLVLVP